MLNMFKRLLFVIILFQYASIHARRPQIEFRHLTAQDGLSHNWVKQIYKDSYGYMWFVTENNGINKYDGYNFTVYKNNPKDKKSLTNNLVTFIYEDKKRNLWVGTHYGLNIYNRELDKFTPYVHLHDRYVHDMLEMDDGKFYVTTVHDLIILDHENKSVDFIIKESDNLPYTFIENEMLKYTNNKFLIGTPEGLFSIETPMNDMIQGILEYSRVGRTEEKVEKVDLNKLLKDVIDLLSPPNNIKITVENKLPEYTADSTRLTQLFENLLSNPIKHLDKPQGIIKVGCASKAGEWEFSISDNGPGIEEQYFEKIFKIFQTLQPDPTGKSTGIGLTIVKKIIDLYEGKIWLESELGKGTIFYFTLPKQ